MKDESSVNILTSWAVVLERSKSPSTRTKLFLKKLFSDDFFVTRLKMMRNKYKVPENGYPLKKIIITRKIIESFGKENKLSKKEAAAILKGRLISRKIIKFTSKFYRPVFELKSSMEADLTSLSDHYSKPRQKYNMQFFLLVTFHSLLNLEQISTGGEIVFCVDEDHISSASEGLEDTVCGLVIREKVSVEKIIKYLKTHRREISKILDQKPKSFRVNYGLFDIAEEIEILTNSGKTDSQIADLLSDKYPDDNRVGDEGWIRTTRSRHKKIVTNS